MTKQRSKESSLLFSCKHVILLWKKEEKTDLNDVEERAENQLENVSAIRWKTNEIIIIDY